MKEYKVVNNYVLFEKLNSDLLGVNYRGGEIKNRKAESHCVVTDVHPALSNSPLTWKRIKLLMEGFKKQNILGLYSPDEIVEGDESPLLIYPLKKERNLENILEDTSKKGITLEFELVFSIALGIAEILETGSNVIINKKSSYHGVLTPDNIIIDFDGKILLKNYGIFPYLADAPQLLSDTFKKFRQMVAPELLKNGPLSPRADIYHLGNITYYLLTGKYFQPTSEEDFKSQMASVPIMDHIHLPKEDLAQSIAQLFQKSLNPNPEKRFANIKEFKEYISEHFYIEELSSATFMLAYFMNLVYKDSAREDETYLEEELAYIIPEKKLEVKEKKPRRETEIDEHLIEDITIELERQKRSRVKVLVPIIILLIAVLGIAGYLIVQQQKEIQKQREAQIQKDRELETTIAQMKSDLLSEYQKRLKMIEEKSVSTDDERKEQSEEIERLKKWREDQEKLNLQRLEAKRLELQRQETQKAHEVKTPPIKETIPEKKIEPESKPKEPEKQPDIKEIKKEEVKILKAGDLVPLNSITFMPSKLLGKGKVTSAELKLSNSILKKYSGKTLNIQADILINETGSVNDVKVKGNLPGEMQAKIKDELKTWTYIPAEKDKIKVKVWLPADITVTFEEVAVTKEKVEVPVVPVKVIPLESVTFSPSKVSGKRKVQASEIKLSRAIKKQYAGQTLTIKFTILINEVGKVVNAKLKGQWPEEIKSVLINVLRDWKYIPAEKDKVPVAVWFPADISISFD
jgi:serine/threonine protein kinase